METVNPLVRLLQHNGPMIREEAATKLGDLARPALKKMTETVTTAAGTACERLKPGTAKAKDVDAQAAQNASQA